MNNFSDQQTQNELNVPQQEARQPWTTPTFEQLPLKEALAGALTNADGGGQS